ncbi:FecR family protein [Chitinophaga sp. CF118]|uniref:FecR family protein n=1 Tax=Chitinophaga sp. CF118 TaxID=1884367 RepID=UPI0008EDD2AB|nr:FecR domain-containing protein [Chitinophaga sp. CF118]SFE96237.1 FecR family protein [Chitinophaga sp. CF118]
MKIDKQILEKYFKGDCTAEEAALIATFLEQPDAPGVDEWFSEVYALSEAKEPVILKRTGINIYRRLYSIAAAVAVLVGVCAWLWQSQQRTAGKAQLALNWDTLANKGNDIKLLSLTDGSKVWLGPHSSLAYTRNYNDTSRELSLDGEAYFEVAHDPARPFSVRTGKLITTALGTAFNIATASQADGSIQVSLVEGKVSVTATAFSCILHPGQMVRYGEGIGTTQPETFKKEEVLDWKSGKLVFDGTPLKDAFAKLQARLGSRIIMDNTLTGTQKVSGVFSAGESLEHILEAMQYVHGFKIVKKNHNTYEITKSN